MHIVETHSLAAGQKIGTPHLEVQYFPLNVEKYICFAPYSKPIKTYDLWFDVLQIILPELQKHNIKIVQIGAKDEQPIPHCLHLQGKTTVLQANYLIKNSLLYFGADTWATHAAGISNIPIVALYSNNSIENVRPYWGDKNKQVLIDCYEENELPVYQLEENPKRINKIKPEEVADAILKLLNIEYNYPFKTIFIPELYKFHILELIPTSNINPAQFNTNSIAVRMDLHFDEQILINQINICPVTIVTNRILNYKIIDNFAKKINQLVFIVSDNNPNNPKFVKYCESKGINILLLSYLPEEQIKDLKLDYAEVGIINKKAEFDFNKIKDFDKSKLYFKTNRLIIYNNQIYPSPLHAKINQPISQNGINKIIDNELFWRDWENYYLLIINNPLAPDTKPSSQI